MVNKAKLLKDCWGGGSVFELFDCVHSPKFHNPEAIVRNAGVDHGSLVTDTPFPQGRGVLLLVLMTVVSE